jgi:sugar phosphate isomerase/epimerase
MKPIALQLFSVREMCKQDLAGTLKLVADMGYQGVEFAGFYGHDPSEVRKMLDDLGLAAAGSHAPLPSRQEMDEYVRTCKTLGLKYVTAMKGAADFDSPEAVEKTAALFEQAACELADNDLTLTYHNHWWEMKDLGDLAALDLLYRKAPTLQAEIDVYWASDFARLDPVDFVKRYAHRMPQLHLKDGPLVRDEKHTALGAGNVDLPACIRAADADVLEWLIVEIDSVDADMLTAVKRSIGYLRELDL